MKAARRIRAVMTFEPARSAIRFCALHDGGWLFADNGWTERRIVIDVPPQGTVLGFGFFLKGTGSVWAADFSVRTVDASTPLTGVPKERPACDASGIAPRNLNFSDEVELTF